MAENRNIKITRDHLSDQVYRILRARILGGELHPGDRVVISNLAREFRVSRTPIRDAINRLIGDGLLTPVPGSGVVISPLTDSDIKDTLEVRLLIELYAAEKGVERITASQLKRMEGLLDEMGLLIVENDYRDLDRFIELDCEFHSIIIDLAESSRLSQIYQSLNAHMQFLRTQHLGKMRGREEYSPRRTHQEHQMIFQACKDRNKKLLKDVLVAHIKGVGEAMLEALAEGKEDAKWLKGHDLAIRIATGGHREEVM